MFARDAVFPYGSGGPNASFAFLTSYYMRTFGATREDFGKLCVAQRDNALGYPHALFKKKLTLEEYLDARPIADPIRLFDCVMPCAGAEAFLVMTRQRAAGARPAVRRACARPASGTTRFPTIRFRCAAAGCSTGIACTAPPASSRPTSTSCRPMTIIR